MPDSYQEIILKPLSVNEAWQGRRFKTDQYKAYEFQVWARLPRFYPIPETGDLEIHLEFGFSHAASDFDNPVKPFVDILSKKYEFNDKRIKRATIDVQAVRKGEEFIRFNLFAKK